MPHEPPVPQVPPTAWGVFEQELALALAALGAGHILMLQLPQTPRFADGATYFVAAALRGHDGVHTEAVSNLHLTREVQLGDDDVERLRALGWEDPLAPTEEGEAGTGSDAAEPAYRNHYRDWPWPVSFAAVAENLVETLVSVYHVPDPSSLAYDAFDENDGLPILLPSLDVPRAPVVHTGEQEAVFRVDSLDEMREMVAGVLASIFEDEPVRMNEEGYFLVSRGSSLTFVQPDVDPPQLHFASPLLTGVPRSAELLERLNDINAQMYHGRVYWNDENVIAEMDLVCSPFVADHVAIACRTMAVLADDVDDKLQDEFGGKTFFGEHVPPKRPGGYGGYL